MTDTSTPPRPCVLDGFLALGDDYRRRHDLGTEFDKDVKSFFAAAVAGEYWAPIRQYFAQNCVSLKEAGAAAGINRSTVSRLLRRETNPSFGTVCQMFAWLDLNPCAVPFPDGRDALARAFVRTVAFLRGRLPEAERGAADPGPFEEEEWDCLRLGVCSEAILEALRAGEDEKPGKLAAATEGVAADLARRYPNGRIKDGAAVRRVFQDWLIPWVLFYTVIKFEERAVES
jgi:transcriptional regulator with XRE-family HTH domain